MDNELLYIISPAELSFSPAGISLPERRARLSAIVRTRGALWSSLRMRGSEFLDSAEKLDGYLRAGGKFVDSAFENSPQAMLPVGSYKDYAPLFGYYDPESVRKFDRELRAIPAAVIDKWEDEPNENSVIGQVVHAFRFTFAEAAKRGHSVVVEHS